MLIDDDLLSAHGFILKGFSHGIHTGCGGNLHLQPGKPFFDEIDEIGNTEGNGIRSCSVDPLQKFDQLSITFSGILKVSQARGIEEITEFQSSLVASPDITFYVSSVDLWQDKPRSCSSHDIEGKFAEKGIDRRALQGIER
jgi:hypothetical protein